ncbi:MAG TPA: tetratricopeptide repeat protein, partial [Candidatus Angelobacter sp.]|nr:tetratricopeptide repeat protein [Candidatus Angelobacter sp.]
MSTERQTPEDATRPDAGFRWHGISLRVVRLRRHVRCGLGVLTLLLCSCVGSFAGGEDVRSTFDQGNKLYEEGRFAEAASAYEKILQSGQSSPEVYFNLGNALFKSGHVGRAILNYRLAEQLAPRDPDIRANLKFARSSAADGGAQTVDWRQRLTGRLAIDEWTLLTAGSLWLWFVLLALGRLRPAL